MDHYQQHDDAAIPEVGIYAPPRPRRALHSDVVQFRADKLPRRKPRITGDVVMTHDELREQVARATRFVDAMPTWKQNILAHSSQPTVSTPRPPVDNFAGSTGDTSLTGEALTEIERLRLRLATVELERRWLLDRLSVLGAVPTRPANNVDRCYSPPGWVDLDAVD